MIHTQWRFLRHLYPDFRLCVDTSPTMISNTSLAIGRCCWDHWNNGRHSLPNGYRRLHLRSRWLDWKIGFVSAHIYRIRMHFDLYLFECIAHCCFVDGLLLDFNAFIDAFHFHHIHWISHLDAVNEWNVNKFVIARSNVFIIETRENANPFVILLPISNCIETMPFIFEMNSQPN